jgi:hypothetical protein
MLTRVIVVALFAMSLNCAISQERQAVKASKMQPAVTCSKDFRAALIGSIYATDGLSFRSSELAWQADRLEAQKSVSLTVQLADQDAELKAAAYAIAAFQSVEACRALSLAGASTESLQSSGCWTRSNELEKKAMDSCSLSFQRVHPQISDFK